MATPAAFDWRSFVCRPAAVLAAWALFCLASLAVTLAAGIEPAGPDDYMRLLQVRDLLGGQSWWDVAQYRLDPPRGASMHWSRLVDLPLAAAALLFGEQAALVAVPLLYLLAALFALRAIMLQLSFGPLATGFGLAILPLFPLLPGTFAPGSIDHHAPQAVIGLVCAALLLRETRLSAVTAGILSAAWVAISLEGLPLVAALAGLYGLLYWHNGDRRLGWYLSALALAAPVLSLATRPISAFSLPFCDILLPGHMQSFAAAAALSLLIPHLPGQRHVAGRLLALATIPLLCFPLVLVALGKCAANPFAALDPLLQTWWYGLITEGLPVWQQPPSVAAMLVWTMLLIAVGWRMAPTEERLRERWRLLALFALAAGLYSLAIMREGVVAQLLAIPFAAGLLAEVMPRARAIDHAALRIAATLACFLLATPTFASAATKWVDPMLMRDTMRAGASARLAAGACDYDRLAQLPPGHVLAPLDNAPEILGKSRHTLVMASYHRNQARMRDVLAAFVGDAAGAREIAVRNQVDYVIACSAEADLALYRTASPGNFANRVARGDVPGWLLPVTGFEDGPLRVYLVR